MRVRFGLAWPLMISHILHIHSWKPSSPEVSIRDRDKRHRGRGTDGQERRRGQERHKSPERLVGERGTEDKRGMEDERGMEDKRGTDD